MRSAPMRTKVRPYIKSALHRNDLNAGDGSAVSLQSIAVGTLQKPSPLYYYHSGAAGIDITLSQIVTNDC